MTPNNIKDAIEYAVGQEVFYEDMGFSVIISKDTPEELVHEVREYFNNNEIKYDTFSYADLKPYL